MLNYIDLIPKIRILCCLIGDITLATAALLHDVGRLLMGSASSKCGDVTIKACHPGKCGYNASFMNHLWGYDWIIVGIFPRVVKHGLLEFPLFSSMIFPLTKEKRAFSRMFDDAIFGILTYSHGIPV